MLQDTRQRDHEMSQRKIRRQRCEEDGSGGPRRSISGWIAMLVILLILPVVEARAQGNSREQLVPVLGVTMDQRPTGVVAYLVVSFEERADHDGLMIHFNHAPGSFSRMAQTAGEEAIYRAAHALGLSTDSWSVVLSVPYEGITLYGESYSAMIALSVVAMAKGDFIPSDRVITGTVTPDGHIGAVGSVPLKVVAANEAHLRRVLIPDEWDPADSAWETPFLMEISPVDSVIEAYHALIDPQTIP